MSLTTEHLTIGYRQGRKHRITIAEDLNVSLQAGELVALIGPNGAGKSTLLRTLAGMQAPLSGRVLLAGEEVHRMDAQQLAQQLSVVLTSAPDAGLLTGYAVVALGRHPYTGWSGMLSDHDEAVVREAVRLVGAEEYAARPITEMSDGQRQKIMIARALAQEPQVMILDEPTAYLDLPRRVEILHLLKQLTRQTKRAVLLSIHDLDLALRTADRIWLMQGDASIVTGAPEDLILSGAFEAAFHKEGVRFDAAAGSFHMPDVVTGEISLTGEGLAQVWTERALTRAGWRVVKDVPEGAPSGAAVCVEVSGEPPRWSVYGQGGAPQSFERIADLLQALAQG